MLDGMVMVEIRPLRTDHSERKAGDAVNALAQAEGWPSFTEPALLRRLIDAPGTLSLIAIVSTAPDPGVVGFAHALTNGHHAYLSVIVVDTPWRGRGVGRQLITSLFHISGVERLDLLSGPESAAFYARLPNHQMTGYRLYPHRRSTGTE